MSNMNFKKWLNLIEVGTMASAPTGGVGDVAPFKAPVGIGMVRRTWPNQEEEEDKKKRGRKK